MTVRWSLETSPPARWRTIRSLSIAAAATASIGAAGGLFFPEVYRDNAFTTTGWWGTDLATLFVATPATLFVATRRSARSNFVLIGLIGYLLYNAAFYSFGARMNVLFLSYAATLSISFFALVLILRTIDISDLHAALPRRGVATFFLLVGGALTIVEVGQVIAFIVTSDLPDVVTTTGHSTHVVAALDLTLVIPFLFTAGVLLLRRNSWGSIVGIAISIKATVYMIGLSLTTVLVADAGFTEARVQLPVWLSIGAGSAVAASALLRSVDRAARLRSSLSDMALGKASSSVAPPPGVSRNAILPPCDCMIRLAR